jgi:hypothetical protein
MKMDEVKQKEGWEKYWSELTTEEKVERMRNEVRSLQTQVKCYGKMIDLFFHHLHQDGKITIPIERHNGGESEERMRRGLGKDDVYF